MENTVTDDEDCRVCGLCWWTDCGNDADVTVHVELKQTSNNHPVYDGPVDLCAGHARWAETTNGRLNIDWAAIHQAIARDSLTK